jgi:hypothetical protein
VLHSAARRLELLLLRELAAANLRRLLDFCRRLQAAVGTDALRSPLAALLLGPHEQHQRQVAAPQQRLDYNEAMVLAASCMLAADTCCGSSTRGASLQVVLPAPIQAGRGRNWRKSQLHAFAIALSRTNQPLPCFPTTVALAFLFHRHPRQLHPPPGTRQV